MIRVFCQPFRARTAGVEPVIQRDVQSSLEEDAERLVVEDNDDSIPVLRRATMRVSRQPPRVATAPYEPPVQSDAQPPEGSEVTQTEADDRHASTYILLQPSRVATASFERPIQTDVQADPKRALESIAEPAVSHSSITDEPLVAYGVDHTLLAISSDALPQEVFRPVSGMSTKKNVFVREREDPPTRQDHILLTWD